MKSLVGRFTFAFLRLEWKYKSPRYTDKCNRSGVHHIGSTEGTPGHFPHILNPPQNSHALKLLSTSTQTETLVELVKICPTYNRLPTVFLLLMFTVLPLSPWPVPRFWFSNLLSQGYCLLGFYKGWQTISKLTYFWF